MNSAELIKWIVIAAIFVIALRRGVWTAIGLLILGLLLIRFI